MKKTRRYRAIDVGQTVEPGGRVVQWSVLVRRREGISVGIPSTERGTKRSSSSSEAGGRGRSDGRDGLRPVGGACAGAREVQQRRPEAAEDGRTAMLQTATAAGEVGWGMIVAGKDVCEL